MATKQDVERFLNEFMKSPITGKEMVLIKEKRTLTFRKEEFGIVYHHFKCEDSGEFFTTTELDEININQLYNRYRERHRLPFPEEVRQIRENYELSASKMSEVLGFGTNGYRNYESGEVPSLSNAKLIQVAADPKEFKKLIERSDAFDGKALDKILHHINSLIAQQKQNKFNNQLIGYLFGNSHPSSFTGYKVPDFEKFSEMVVFFAERMEPWKTKLNKLLFYADFSMYAKKGCSISGAQYVAIPLGPVPNNFQSIYELLANNGIITIEYSKINSEIAGEKFSTTIERRFNPSLFTIEELNLLEQIASRFNKTSTQKIIDYSHEEKAWIENLGTNKVIDYEYGFYIK